MILRPQIQAILSFGQKVRYLKKIFSNLKPRIFKYLNILFLQKNYDFPIFIIFGQNHVCSRMSFVR